jgi:tetratricopeptide (TPR) repeat protein
MRPRDPDAWNQLGHSLDVAGRLPEAVAAFVRATRLPPLILGRAYLYRDLAEAREKIGDLAGAIAAARVSLRSWPLSRDGLHCSGFEVRLLTRLLVKAHEISGALALFGPLYRANPAGFECGNVHDALIAAASR